MAQNIVEIGDVHVRIPVDNSGGDGPGHTEGGGMAEAADGGGHVRVQVPVDDGGGGLPQFKLKREVTWPRTSLIQVMSLYKLTLMKVEELSKSLREET